MAASDQMRIPKRIRAALKPVLSDSQYVDYVIRILLSSEFGGGVRTLCCVFL